MKRYRNHELAVKFHSNCHSQRQQKCRNRHRRSDNSNCWRCRNFSHAGDRTAQPTTSLPLRCQPPTINRFDTWQRDTWRHCRSVECSRWRSTPRSAHPHSEVTYIFHCRSTGIYSRFWWLFLYTVSTLNKLTSKLIIGYLCISGASRVRPVRRRKSCDNNADERAPTSYLNIR